MSFLTTTSIELCLILVGVLRVTCSDQGRTANVTDFCSNYSTMMSCINDPCCKTGAFPTSSCCDYCEEDNGFCKSHEMMKDYCSSDHIIQHNQYPRHKSKSTPTQSRPCIVYAYGYYLNLTMTNPIVSIASSGVKMSVNFCSDVAIEDTGMSDSCSACAAPILLSELSDTGSVCWPIGDASTMTGSFVSEKEPGKGVVLHYGTVDCCFRDPGEANRVTNKLVVELAVVPDRNLSEYEGNKTDPKLLDWRVTRFLDISSLHNCSLAVGGKLKGEIALRDYFRRLVYKLSPSASQFSCKISGDLVTCQVIPVWAFNLSLAASSVCRRLKVRFLYSDGRDKLVGMSEVNHHSDQCKFTVNSNSSLIGLEVLDSDDTSFGTIISISVPFSGKCTKSLLLVVVASTVVSNIAIVIVLFCTLRYRRKFYKLRRRRKFSALYEPNVQHTSITPVDSVATLPGDVCHSAALSRPVPSTPLLQLEDGSPPEDKAKQSPDEKLGDKTCTSHQQGSEASLLVTTKDKKPTSRSHVLILHHDNSYDAADALRITEDLTRNGICCISHHLEYSKILEMGEKDWLASSLLRCYCVLLICTKAFWDASKGRNESHFIVCQRLIAEAVKCLSCVTCDGVHSFPIIRKASDRTFIPDCVKDCEWFQLPSESQWTELISTIRQRLITIRKTVEFNHHLSMDSDSAYGSAHDVGHSTAD